MTLVHVNAPLFADDRSQQGYQHVFAADCGHSGRRSADRQHADQKPAAHSPVCVERPKQTFRTSKSSRRLATTHKTGRWPQCSQ